MLKHDGFSKCLYRFVLIFNLKLSINLKDMSTFKINPEAPDVYSEEIIIRSYQVDIHRKLTIPKLCSFFQDIAGNHTVACGVGWDVMQAENVFWVLSKLKIVVKKYPVWEDKITLRTWSNGLSGLFAVRHFQVLSAKGEELISAISMWLMVNTKTRRLVRADDYMRDFPLSKVRLFEAEPGKVPGLEEPVDFEASTVSFTETDMNNHMNNVNYIDRIINSYNYDFLMKHQIEELEINFLKEAVNGDLLTVKQQRVTEKEFLNSIVLLESGKETVRTKMKWRSLT